MQGTTMTLPSHEFSFPRCWEPLKTAALIILLGLSCFDFCASFL
jgi:hypothetical protein